GRVDERVVVGVPGALDLEVGAAGEAALPRLRRRARGGGIPLQQRLSDVAVARAGQRDQAVGSGVEPRGVDLGTTAVLVRQVRAGQPLAELEIADAIGAQ